MGGFFIDMQKFLHYFPLYLLGLLSLVAAAYFPGLSGGYLLDDFGSLSPLGQWAEVNSVAKLKEFVLAGYTGPLGRPIPLFSFALNASTWPADPMPFLATNVAIHLCNVVLVYWVVSALLGAANVESGRAGFVALLAAALWGLHPYSVSTVLYIVQRMTLLSALFSFAAIFGYLKGRTSLLENRFHQALFYWALAGLAAMAAVFSKENAVLLPLQILLVEVFLAASGARAQNGWLGRGAKAVIAVASVIVVYRLVDYAYPHVYAAIVEGRELGSRRDFSFFERQLTQLRVVGDYIVAILLPQAQTAGVFQDGYPVSKSLFSPPSTLYWLIAHAALIVLAVLLRRKQPIVFFGILWFYVGHLVESSVVMLELKFEHRNYLPSLGLLLPIAFGLSSQSIAKSGQKLVVGALLVLLAALLVMRTSLWGQPEQASLVWVDENPLSARALENAALVNGADPQNYPVVKSLLHKAVLVSGGDPVVEIKYINYICVEPGAGGYQWPRIAEAFKTSSVNWQLYGVLSEMLSNISDGKCRPITLEQFSTLTSAVLTNPKYRRTGTPKLIRELRARAALIFGRNDLAVELYRQEIPQKIPLDMVMRHALWLASYGELTTAREILVVGIERASEKGSQGYLLAQAGDMLSKIESEIAQQ